MANIMNWLVPKEEKFFEMLTEQSENALEASKKLKDFIDSYSKLDRNAKKSRVQEIKDIEHKGDELSHKIIEKLNVAFITPIDKEDLYRMTVIIDDITDLINAAALRFVLLSIERIDDYIIKFIAIINESISELIQMISSLKGKEYTKDHLLKIHELENKADEIYHKALSELFHFYKNSIDIMKYKEIYEILERTTDKCEEVSQVIENVMVKNS